ncbi:MAG: hypothetical protein U0270_41130 [Labilithrix sp.]
MSDNSNSPDSNPTSTSSDARLTLSVKRIRTHVRGGAKGDSIYEPTSVSSSSGPVSTSGSAGTATRNW